MGKFKRDIVLPIALVIYIAVIAVISFPHYRETENWTEFGIIIFASLVVAFLLSAVLYRRKKIRDKNRK